MKTQHGNSGKDYPETNVEHNNFTPVLEGYRVYGIEMGSTSISWRCPKHPPQNRKTLLPIMRLRPDPWTEERCCEQCGAVVKLPPLDQTSEAFDLRWMIDVVAKSQNN